MENQLESRLEEALNAMCFDDVVCEVATVEAVCEGILAEAEEEATNGGYYRRKKRAATDFRDTYWPGDDHTKWKYWQRDGGLQEFDAPKVRAKRQLGLLQPMFLLPKREENEGREESNRGNYIGVMTDLIARSMGKDISASRLASFLSNLEDQKNHFDSNGFMAAFSHEFGEGKAAELRQLAQKFGVNTLTPDTLSNLTSSASQNAEVIHDLNGGPSQSLHRFERIQQSPDIPMRDEASPSQLDQLGVRVQGLQRAVQSVSRSSFKVKFQVQGNILMQCRVCQASVWNGGINMLYFNNSFSDIRILLELKENYYCFTENYGKLYNNISIITWKNS